MQELTALVSSINSVLWGPYCLIPLLVGAGVIFTFRLKFVQVRRFGRACKFFLTPDKMKGEQASASTGMSSLQSLATAVAAQVGTGSLAGVATALAMGGPGAIFWMWIAAFFGMATIFVEAVLAQLYKATDSREHVTGGPAFYIANGLKSKPLAVFFAVTIILALGLIGNAVQANSIADAFQSAFGMPVWLCGAGVALLSGFVFIGGIRRIASTTEKLVPIMAMFYLVGGAIVLVMNYENFIPAMKMIFVGAFDPVAATGGAIGATVQEAIRYGVARGLFSNEAGMGSTPHAHAIARVKYPAEQGMVAVIGVFVTTFVVVTMTAMVILMTGVLDGKTTGIILTQRAFETGMGSIGVIFVAICLFFFAFSTIIGWYFFAEQNVKYLFGHRAVFPYQCAVVLFVFLGSLMHVNLVWELADLFNGLMVLPNLIALLALCGLVVKALKVYEDSPDSKIKGP